ncbi:PAS domain S-box protein [bacterium]|nr:PAS domain S-box protein [bacterium]
MEKNRGALNPAPTGESFRNLIKALPDIVYVLDGAGRFLYLNDAARSIGYDPETLIGRHFFALIHEEDRPRVSREVVVARIRAQDHFPETPPKLFDERRSGQRMTRELEVRLIHGATGQVIYCSVNAYGEPIVDPVLRVMFKTEGPVTIGVIHDITAAHLYRKSLEENLASKEIQLKEIHHRVRDNLQVITSLAHLREMDIAEEKARRSLAELIAQIKSISLVYEALYQAEDTRGAQVRDYFERFARLMAQSHGRVGFPVTLAVEAAEGFREADKLSFMAMIASEFVAAAYRHDFPAGGEARIVISWEALSDREILTVFDNGTVPPAEARTRAGTGTEIAEALARQLGGHIEEPAGPGTTMRLVMPPA